MGIKDGANKIIGFECLINQRPDEIVDLFDSIVKSSNVNNSNVKDSSVKDSNFKGLDVNEKKLIPLLLKLSSRTIEETELLDLLDLISQNQSDFNNVVENIKTEFEDGDPKNFEIFKALIAAMDGDLPSFGYILDFLYFKGKSSMFSMLTSMLSGKGIFGELKDKYMDEEKIKCEVKHHIEKLFEWILKELPDLQKLLKEFKLDYLISGIVFKK